MSTGSTDEADPVASTHRGTLTMPSSVVAKIAAQAAFEVNDVGAASGGVLGLGRRREFHDRPKAEARLFGNTAVITLDVGVAYPVALRTATARVREHVRNRVRELTGFEVDQVDLTISWLHPSTTTTRRGELQ